MEKKNDYENRRFLFYCRGCSKNNYDKKEFEVDHFQRVRGAVLICLDCGFRISRNVKLLDQQLEEGKK